ncbi:hypothetical protein COOONC_07231 [Cooperia oncophora]
MTTPIITAVIGLLAVVTQALAQDDPTQPVVIRLHPMSTKPRFLSEVSAPRAVQAPIVPPAPQPNAVAPAATVAQQPLPPSPPSPQHPVLQQTAPPGSQQFVPRTGGSVPPPPPVTIPPDVQNQLIKFFGLDSFGIPGLTGNHPNGFAGAVQELRAAGIPVQGLPAEHLTGNAVAHAAPTQSDVLAQANPKFQDQISQLVNEARNPGPYDGAGGQIPLPADKPGENGLIGLLSNSIRKLVKETGVSDALSQSLPSLLGNPHSSSSRYAAGAAGAGGSAASAQDGVVVSQSVDDNAVTNHVRGSNIRRQPSTAQRALSGISSFLGGGNTTCLGGGNTPTHAGLPRIPGIPLLPGGIPRNAQGQIDVVNLIGSITRRLSNGTTLADMLPPEQLQTLADNVTDALLPETPTNFDLSKFMGRWFEGINSPRATEQRCVVHHYGGLTKNDKTATFTALKIYREGSEFGPVRYSIGYAFRGGNKDAMLQLHTSESSDAQPFWIYKLGPEGKDPFGNPQYEYAIVSNWVRYPVTVLVRDPDTFKAKYQTEMDINTITGIIGGIGRMLETNVDTINVPSELIMGRWFQMYKAAINFDVFRTQMFCPVAYFSPNPIMGEDGFSMEEAYRTVSKTGPIETYKRDMNKVGPGQYWMYTEEYFYPRQFYIIAAGPSFHNETGKADEPIQYIAVTDANRLSLAVYARDPHIFFQKYNKDILEFMEKKGFGGRVFWNSPRPIYQGPDCEWPSEKEVFARRVLKNQELAERSRNGTAEPAMSGMPLADILRDPKKTLERLVGNQEVSSSAADQSDMQWLCALVVAVVVISLANGQHDAFALPQAPRYAPKPTVPPEYSSFFELDGHARELVDSLLGPRPGGLFPEKTYEIGAPSEPVSGNKPVHVPSTLERTLEQFFTAPEPASGQALPPGFGSGFSLLNNNKPVTSFGSTMRRAPQKSTSEEVEGSGEEPKSSIMGIPKVFPKLPKAPIAQPEPIRRREPSIIGGTPNLPLIPAAPEVPEGGFLPADIRRSPQSVSGVASSLDDDDSSDMLEDEFAGEESSTSSGGLIGTIFNLIGMGQKKLAEANKGGALGAKASAEDKNAFGKAVSNLIGGENSPLPAKNMISNVLYKALTSGSVQVRERMQVKAVTFPRAVSIQPNDTKAENPENPFAPLSNGSIVLTPAQSAAITENLEMVQNFIIQPSSPLCTQKPEPVAFDFYSFMGQWYQVVYSPPFSTGQCSMVAYKKLNDVNNGGPGSIFETFEYTTDGTPYGKPKISSGYAMIRSPGELIYRTTSNQEDVNVHVLHVGPLNANNEYDYAIMSTNCNFPLYVFARDPVTYRQRYETEVNTILEKKGLVNGISRLLNIVAPVENSLCTFPPSLFNIHG